MRAEVSRPLTLVPNWPSLTSAVFSGLRQVTRSARFKGREQGVCTMRKGLDGGHLWELTTIINQHTVFLLLQCPDRTGKLSQNKGKKEQYPETLILFHLKAQLKSREGGTTFPQAPVIIPWLASSGGICLYLVGFVRNMVSTGVILQWTLLNNLFLKLLLYFLCQAFKCIFLRASLQAAVRNSTFQCCICVLLKWNTPTSNLFNC